MPVKTISWIGAPDRPREGVVRLVDQTLLPTTFEEITCTDSASLWEAIRMLRVRGAPALGVAAAFGIPLGLRETKATSHTELIAELNELVEYLGSSRPTAVNLFWALERMQNYAASLKEHSNYSINEILTLLLKEALTIAEEDRTICRTLGTNGAALLPEDATVLTHCNAGALATADYGTALGVIYAAKDMGKNIKVYADETRPLLQGARLTAWELCYESIDVTVITDNMAGVVLRDKSIDAVIVGADRIAANGDTANKIGTYSLAILAKEHNVPFYVAAPSSTFDLTLKDGSLIPIEERPPDEVSCPVGTRIAPKEAKIFNPAFDVTPNALITAIITEVGLLKAPYIESISENIPTTKNVQSPK